MHQILQLQRQNCERLLQIEQNVKAPLPPKFISIETATLRNNREKFTNKKYD